MKRMVCTALISLHAILLSAQSESVELSFTDFVEWLIGKYEVSVTYAHDILIEEMIQADTSHLQLEDAYLILENLKGIDFILDDTDRIFIRKRDEARDILGVFEFLVIDKSTSPLSHVAISIPATSVGGYTDDRGSLKLEIPKKFQDDTLLIQMLGFDRHKMVISDLKKNSSITLSQSTSMVEDVLVEDRRDKIQISPAESKLELSALDLDPSGLYGNDILRQVQAMAGVVAFEDDDAGIKIRGSQSDQTLMMIDGIPLYGASHYYGIFGAINGSYIEHINLYKNNLPIQYGEKNGGMLDMQSRKMEAIEGLGGSIDVNLLTSSAVLYSNIGTDWTIELGARSTYQNVTNSGLLDVFDSNSNIVVQNLVFARDEQITNSDPEFSFYDLNASLGFSPSSNFIIEGNFYRSYDELINDVDATITLPGGNRDEGNGGAATTYDNETWTNEGFSWLSNWKINESFNLSAQLFRTKYESQDSSTTDMFVKIRDRVIDRGGFLNTSNSISETGARGMLTAQLGDLRLDIGLERTWWRQDFFNTDSMSIRLLDLSLESSATSTFSNFTLPIKGGWTVSAGVRGTYYNQVDKFYISPRINISKKMTDQLSLRTSVGRQFQLTQNLTFETPYGRSMDVWLISFEDTRPGRNRDVPVSALDHVMLGATMKKNRWLIDLEAYYRYTKDITEIATEELVVNTSRGGTRRVGQGGYEFYHGSGRTVGMDLTMAYTGRRFGSMLTYTLSRSEQSFKGISNGVWHPSGLDRRHQVQWINDYKIGNWNMGISSVYATGRTYTDISNIDMSNNRRDVNPRDRISRLPDYFRVDFGLGYDFKLFGKTSTISTTLFNVFDRENVSYLQYTFELPINQSGSRAIPYGNTSSLLGRTWNIGWQLEF